MEKNKIERINELARKAKAEGLTEAEKKEQAVLRQEYILAFRQNLRGTLDNTYVIGADGVKRTLAEHDKMVKEAQNAKCAVRKDEAVEG